MASAWGKYHLSLRSIVYFKRRHHGTENEGFSSHIYLLGRYSEGAKFKQPKTRENPISSKSYTLEEIVNVKSHYSGCNEQDIIIDVRDEETKNSRRDEASSTGYLGSLPLLLCLVSPLF